MTPDGKLAHGIIHSDLKPENVLCFQNNIVKISDFAFSTYRGDKPIGDTLEYTAPERVERKQEVLVRTRNDIWSFGVLCAQLLAGLLPFNSRFIRSKSFSRQECIDAELDKFFRKIDEKRKRELDPDGSLESIIRACLQADPETRPTAKRLLGHPLFQRLLSSVKEVDDIPPPEEISPPKPRLRRLGEKPRRITKGKKP